MPADGSHEFIAHTRLGSIGRRTQQSFDDLIAASRTAAEVHRIAMAKEGVAAGKTQAEILADEEVAGEACIASCIADCAVFDMPASNLEEVIAKLRLHLGFGRFGADHAARPSWDGSQIDDYAIMAKIVADLERLAAPSPSDRLLIEAGAVYLEAREARQSLDDPCPCFGDSAGTDALLKLEDNTLNLLLDSPAHSLAALAAKAKAIRAQHYTTDGGCSLDDELSDLSERLIGSLTRDLVGLPTQPKPFAFPEAAGLAAKWVEARAIDEADFDNEAAAQAAVARMCKLDREILDQPPASATDCMAKLMACRKSLEDGEMGGEKLALGQVIEWLERASHLPGELNSGWGTSSTDAQLLELEQRQAELIPAAVNLNPAEYDERNAACSRLWELADRAAQIAPTTTLGLRIKVQLTAIPLLVQDADAEELAPFTLDAQRLTRATVTAPRTYLEDDASWVQ